MNGGRGMANHAYTKRDTRDDLGPVNAGHGLMCSGQEPASNIRNYNGQPHIRSDGSESQMLTTQPTFTPKQYNKILQIIDNEDVMKIFGSTTIICSSITCNILSMNCMQNNRFISLMSTCEKQGEWIVDSGATIHMTSKFRNLDEVSSSHGDAKRRVYLPNGETTRVTHTGKIKLPASDILSNGLVVHDFKFDLLLVSQLTR